MIHAGLGAPILSSMQELQSFYLSSSTRTASTPFLLLLKNTARYTCIATGITIPGLIPSHHSLWRKEKEGNQSCGHTLHSTDTVSNRCRAQQPWEDRSQTAAQIAAESA